MPKALPSLPEQDEPAASAQRPTGRPPKGSRAMTPAERQAAYRKRQWRAQLTALEGDPKGQPTGAILNALGVLLRDLKDPQKAEFHDSLRWVAEQVLKELCERYGLKPLSSQ